MERREFCRFIGACAVVGCSGALAGCARVLDWSAGGGNVVQRQVKPGRASVAAGDATRSAEPSGSVDASSATPARLPDLAQFTGTDPAANVRAAIAAIGGMSRFVGRGDHVLVKPNVLTARAPELATTTNPTVVATVVRLALEAGAADVVVADRPTGPARGSFETSGIAQAVQAAGGRVKYLTDQDFADTAIPGAHSIRTWPILKDVFDADVLINVPIAKNHGMAGLTMSMKNLMGVLGGARGDIHQDFASKICDVNSLVRPHLTVLDAYRILIRNGPTGGDPADVRTPKTCIVGTDPVAVDSLGTALFGMKPSDLPYLTLAAQRKLGVTDLSTLDIMRGTT